MLEKEAGSGFAADIHFDIAHCGWRYQSLLIKGEIRQVEIKCPKCGCAEITGSCISALLIYD
jgi:hypothetical protein